MILGPYSSSGLRAVRWGVFRQLALGTLLAVLSAMPGLRAQVTVAPNATVWLPDVELVAPTLVDQVLSPSLAMSWPVDPSDDFQFVLTTSVLKSASNPFGSDALIFAYQLTNVAAPNSLLGLTDPGIGRDLEWGITELWISSFTGYNVAVGEDVPGSGPVGVVPGPMKRDNLGHELRFTYPPFNGLNRAPPIYVGEYSNTLYVFTDATDYMTSSAMVVSDVIEFPRDEETLVSLQTEKLAPGYNWRTEALEILAPAEYVPPPASVPDSGTTAGLLALAGFVLAAARQRRQD